MLVAGEIAGGIWLYTLIAGFFILARCPEDDCRGANLDVGFLFRRYSWYLTSPDSDKTDMVLWEALVATFWPILIAYYLSYLPLWPVYKFTGLWLTVGKVVSKRTYHAVSTKIAERSKQVAPVGGELSIPREQGQLSLTKDL